MEENEDQPQLVPSFEPRKKPQTKKYYVTVSKLKEHKHLGETMGPASGNKSTQSAGFQFPYKLSTNPSHYRCRSCKMDFSILSSLEN